MNRHLPAAGEGRALLPMRPQRRSGTGLAEGEERLAALLERDGVIGSRDNVAWQVAPSGWHEADILLTGPAGDANYRWGSTTPTVPSLVEVVDELLTDARAYAECDTVFDFCVDHPDYDPDTDEAQQRWAVLEDAYSDACTLFGDRWGEYAYGDPPAQDATGTP